MEFETNEIWEVEKTMPRKRAIWTAAAIAVERNRRSAIALPGDAVVDIAIKTRQ